MAGMEIAVIDEPAAACSALDPVRSRLLAALTEPGSASTVAKKVGLSRQKANYHLRDLEQHGLVELVEERRRGNMVERVLRASAPAFVISPAALAELVRGARKAGKPLATFAIDGEVRFATAADRAAFADELGLAVRDLVARYHDEGAPGGRGHRIVVALHPSLKPAPAEPGPTARPSPPAATPEE